MLEAWGRSRHWRGSDPYDGLGARRLAAPLRASVSGRRVLTQVVKRSPVDLRPLLAIPPGRSPASLAWVGSAYAINGFLEQDVSAARLSETLDALWEERSGEFEEPCWGYHFDVQTRVFYYPRGSPNTIATAFAGHAFLDGFESIGERRWLQIAEGAGEFFLARVPATETPEGAFFGYLAADRTPIHNANMLACGLLARLAQHSGRSEWRDAASAAAAYTLAHQRPDGSWPYGEQPHLAWVDNFHTGYVLEALMRCSAAGVATADADRAVRRGLDYYRRALFRGDGAPMYSPGSLYPIDIQCVSQGVQTFALAGRTDPAQAEWATRVADWGLAHMRRRDGAFMFQRRRLWANRTPHVRWCQAPMLLALAHLISTAPTAGPDRAVTARLGR